MSVELLITQCVYSNRNGASDAAVAQRKSDREVARVRTAAALARSARERQITSTLALVPDRPAAFIAGRS